MTDPTRKPNRLIHEVSPYLQQHAHNPVDWHPWGPAALARAKQEDKPIFLSVGYSACHWCHVMERESFEDEEIAAYLNEHFVSIKVDREERPDLDMIYQRACQLMGQHGGWPLSAFLTPDQRPFWVGTYLPPDDRYGRPGFPRLLRGLVDAYRSRRDEVERVGNQVAEALKEVEGRRRPAAPVEAGEAAEDLLARGAHALVRAFDHRNGGFGTAPKFPNTSAFELWLRHAERSGEKSFREMVLFALRQMARGGIYDHLGGGFHRYSVDAAWSVPHFEKMLYDNAQLPPLYLAAYQLTGEESFAAVVRETLDYVLREMTHPEGGFYSTQDADSEGEEGKFFAWAPPRFAAVLGEDAELLARRFGVTEEGNFEHQQTVLHIGADLPALAAEFGLPEAEVARRIEAGKARLFAVREGRVKPGTDDKVLTGWNGLMIAAFASAGAGLGEPRYVEAARRAADFLAQRLAAPDGSLRRRFKDGRAAIDGYLEDYAFLAHGLLELYQATFERRFLDEALRLTRETLRRFWDDAAGFYYTPAAGEPLIHRPRDVHDTSVPSATAVATANLVRLAPFAPPAEADDFHRRAGRVFELLMDELRSNPWGNATLLQAWDLYRGGLVEITLAGAPGAAEVAGWADRLRRMHIPGRLLSLVPPGVAGAADAAGGAMAVAAGGLPSIWAGRAARDGKPTAYVCRNFACSVPLHGWEQIEAELTSSRPSPLRDARSPLGEYGP